MDRLHRYVREILQQKEACTSKSMARCARSFVMRVFPFLSILRGYSFRYDLPRDVVAGLTVGILHVPQGLAYTLLIGLPPVYGLYSSLYPSLIYFFLGTSRHVSLGTFALSSLMIGSIVKEGVTAWKSDHHHHHHHHHDAVFQHSNGSDSLGNTTDSEEEEALLHIKLTYAMSATFAVGLVQLLLGVTGVGRVASFMSDALISGFTMGAALHVLPSQFHAIFGLHFVQHPGFFRLPYEYGNFFLQIHRTQWVTLVTSLVTMVILVVVREGVNNNKKRFPHLPVPVPVELLLLIGVTLVSHYLNFAASHDVKVIGVIPKSIPSVDVSVLRFVPRVLSKGIVLGFIFFALSFAAAKLLADKHAYTLDANQELIALGMANSVGPFFSAFASSVSFSRSLVQEEIAGLVSSFFVLIVLLFIGPLFQSLPTCVLAVIIVVSLKKLYLQCTLLPRFWRVSKTDFTVWLVVFTATVLVDLDVGLVVGLVFSLFAVLFTTQTPYVCSLGQTDSEGVYADVNGPKTVQEVPGVKIFRFEAALYFGNAHNFRTCLERETGLSVKDLKQKQADTQQNEQRDQDASLVTSTLKDYQTIKDGPLPSPLPCADQVKVKVIVVDGSIWQTLDSLSVTVLTQVEEWRRLVAESSVVPHGPRDYGQVKIIRDYKDVGIDVCLAECKPRVSAILETSGFYDHVDRGHVFDTIHEAVCQAVHHSQDSSAPAVK